MPRLFYLLLITISLTLAVGLLAPQQLGVTLYKISLVSLAAVCGYWIDRAVFPYARPDRAAGCKNTPQLRRSILMSAVIIAVSLGA